MASLKQDCGTKFGPAQKKGLLKWQQAFLVLRQGDDTLYEFRTDLVCSMYKNYANLLKVILYRDEPHPNVVSDLAPMVMATWEAQF